MWVCIDLDEIWRCKMNVSTIVSSDRQFAVRALIRIEVSIRPPFVGCL